MKIVIWVISAHGARIQDPEYCESHPLGGSETAAVKMAECFRKMGETVEIYTDAEIQSDFRCDVFISLRYWTVFELGIRPGKLNYLWCQDDVDQALVSPLSDGERAKKVYQNCDGVMVISHYQFRRWIETLNLPPEKGFLTQNGISLEKFKVDPGTLATRAPRAYYASTPFRGLALIPDLWPLVTQIVPEAELVVCSSFTTYGIPDRDDPYQELFSKLKSTPGITYRAGVGQAELREIAASSRLLAYPCIFPETGCIAAMEAMASGCAVVATDLGALPETAWRNPLFPLEAGGLERWVDEVVRILVDDDYYLDYAIQNLHLAQMMDWERVAKRWKIRFEEDFLKKGES